MADMGMVHRLVVEMVKADLNDDCWDALTEEIYDQYERMARAAIEAMREPTPGMIEAASHCLVVNDDGNDPKDVWQTMLDAASHDTLGNGRPPEERQELRALAQSYLDRKDEDWTWADPQDIKRLARAVLGRDE